MNTLNFTAGQRHWLKPPMVTAPHPDDRTKTASYSISEHFTYCNAAVSRLSPIFQVWAHIVGELPPINNISRLLRGVVIPTLTTLADSVACFRGVKRPYDDEENGESVLVYVLNPTVTIDHEPSLVCLAKAVKVPSDVALTVQVKPKKALHGADDRVEPATVASGADGVVTRLEFVSGNGATPILPKRHSERYLTRLWS